MSTQKNQISKRRIIPERSIIFFTKVCINHQDKDRSARREAKSRGETRRGSDQKVPALQDVGGSFWRSLSSFRILLEAMAAYQTLRTLKPTGEDRWQEQQNVNDETSHIEEIGKGRAIGK